MASVGSAWVRILLLPGRSALLSDRSVLFLAWPYGRWLGLLACCCCCCDELEVFCGLSGCWLEADFLDLLLAKLRTRPSLPGFWSGMAITSYTGQLRDSTIERTTSNEASTVLDDDEATERR